MYRQLYAEPAGLEIKYNKIVIKGKGSTNKDPSILLKWWRASMSTARREWIDRADIELGEGIDWWAVFGAG